MCTERTFAFFLNITKLLFYESYSRVSHIRNHVLSVRSKPVSYRMSRECSSFLLDDYAKDGGPEVVCHLCSFYLDPLRS